MPDYKRKYSNVPNRLNIKDERINTSNKTLARLKALLTGRTCVYIDYANVRSWAHTLLWRLDLGKLERLFGLFSSIEQIYLYTGIAVGDEESEKRVTELKKFKYHLVTKPVKKMSIPIDVSRHPENSIKVLGNFISKALLAQFDEETITFLNKKLAALNKGGMKEILEYKCNFDVEIAAHMAYDTAVGNADTVVLLSGDSDFAPLVRAISDLGKNVVLLSTKGRISHDLQELIGHGLKFFDIKFLKNFLAWDVDLKRRTR